MSSAEPHVSGAPHRAEESFVANVRRVREELGMSQEALASAMRECGHPFHQATVYKLESGSRRLMLDEAVDIARILRCSVQELLMLPEEHRLAYAVSRAEQKVDIAHRRAQEAAMEAAEAQEQLDRFRAEYERAQREAHGDG